MRARVARRFVTVGMIYVSAPPAEDSRAMDTGVLKHTLDTNHRGFQMMAR